MKVTRLEARTGKVNPYGVAVAWRLDYLDSGFVAREGGIQLPGNTTSHVLGEWPQGLEATSLWVWTGDLINAGSLVVTAKSGSAIVGRVSFSSIERWMVQEKAIELATLPVRSKTPLLLLASLVLGVLAFIQWKGKG